MKLFDQIISASIDWNAFAEGETARILAGTMILAAAVALVYLIYHFISKRLAARAGKTKTVNDDFILEQLRIPLFLFTVMILLRIYIAMIIPEGRFEVILDHLADIMLIVAIGWIVSRLVRIVFHFLEYKLDSASDENLEDRRDLTKMKIFEGLINGLIVVIIVSVSLMTFDKVRTLGLSLLTSAGIAGVIVGFAAQKSIAMILAGIQIAITQPIRLDDVVVVEGEWGRIDEITMTYVVVKIWDQRRLVLPINYFLEKPFQNWTRTSAEILGTVYMYVDYTIPLAPLRNKLIEIVENHPKWDRRVANIQVTDMKPESMELRILLSTKNSSLNWDLRVDVREQLIGFILENYPGTFARARVSPPYPDEAAAAMNTSFSSTGNTGPATGNPGITENQNIGGNKNNAPPVTATFVPGRMRTTGE